MAMNALATLLIARGTDAAWQYLRINTDSDGARSSLVWSLRWLADEIEGRRLTASGQPDFRGAAEPEDDPLIDEGDTA